MTFDELVQRLPALLLEWIRENRTASYILVALVVGFVIGRYASYRAFRRWRYQNRGEALVARVLQTSLRSRDYHLMNHVTLPIEGGTTQVDHILVSRFGVFVIETKDYSGWIFADAHQAKWTQVLYKFKSRFQNPIFQNGRHVRAVRGVLDFLPPGSIKPLVVFTGDVEFKTEIPQGVLFVGELVPYLRDHTVEVMSLNRMQFCVGRLETMRLAVSSQTDVQHIEAIERRLGRRTW